MTVVEKYLAHAAQSVREVWGSSLPAPLLDIWWALAQFERVYAVLEAWPLNDAAPLLARFAHLDRDRQRSRWAASRSLAVGPETYDRVALTLPQGDEVIDAAVQETLWHSPREDELRRLLDPRTEPILPEEVADHPGLQAWAAVQLPAGAGEDALRDAWAQSSVEDAECLWFATRKSGAWDTVPEEQRPRAARLAALAIVPELVSRFIAEASPELLPATMVEAAVGSQTVPGEWHEPIRAAAARTVDSFNVGAASQADLFIHQWASARCSHSGMDDLVKATFANARSRAADIAERLVSSPEGSFARWADAPAHLRYRETLEAGGEDLEQLRTSISRSLNKAAKRPTPIHFYLLFQLLCKLGDRAHLDIVRDAIDRIEAAHGPLASLHNSGADVLTYYPGRALEAWAATTTELASVFVPASFSRIVVGLVRDGQLAKARELAEHVVSQSSVGELSIDVVARLAPAFFADADVRRQWQDAAREVLASTEAVRAWLSAPV